MSVFCCGCANPEVANNHCSVPGKLVSAPPHDEPRAFRHHTVPEPVRGAEGLQLDVIVAMHGALTAKTRREADVAIQASAVRDADL